MTTESIKTIRLILAGKIGEAEKENNKTKIKQYSTTLKEFNKLVENKNIFY